MVEQLAVFGLPILIYVLAGFAAQMIDGALGMAYGVSLTSLLLSTGMGPAAASASVHMAEVFVSGVSGFSHLKFGNVNKRLFVKLLVPGIVGGVLGAYVLTTLPVEIIKPLVSLYLLAMGLMIIRRAFRKTRMVTVETKLIPLGLVGGFCDAIGGGGWGPVVTSTLIARGNVPRTTIGSVNLVEFFVTIAEVATFVVTIGLVHWQTIIGLIVGGCLAAPLAARVCKRLPSRTLMALVGLVVTVLSVRTIWMVL